MFRKAKQEMPAGGDEALFQALGKSKRAKRRRVLRTVIILVCVLAAGVTGGVIYLRQQVREQFASSGQEVLSAAAERGSISTVVSGSGTLVNVDTETVCVPSGVEVTETLVEYGDAVQTGDLLAIVDMASVRTAMASLQEEIEPLDDEISDAKGETVSSTVAAGVRGRVKRLYAQQGDSVEAVMVFDETGTLVMVAWLSSEPAQPTEPTEPTGPTQPTEPTDPTAPTQPGGGQSGGFSGGGGASFGGGQQTQSSFTLYSLEKITVASVTSQAHMTLEITVDELDITKVQPGQSASVTLDALPGERFEATVSQVAASGTNEGGSSKFTVELTLEKDSQMLPGMQASAFLTLDTAQNVLCVPAAALGEENGEPVLYTALDPDTGTPTAPLSVTLGTADADYTQILTPLPSDTTVYYPYYE